MTFNISILNYSKFELEKIKISLSCIGSFNFIDIASHKDLLDSIDKVSSSDIILLDINFPTCTDGLYTLAYLKKNMQLKDIPIIVLNKSDNEEDKSLALKNSANDYIIYPCTLERLEKSLKNFINFDTKTKYSFNNSSVITLSTEDYITREINFSHRFKKNLSIILITPLNLKDTFNTSEKISSSLNSTIYDILTSKLKVSCRSIDTIILNNSNDILLILPFTDSSGAQNVIEKVKLNLSKALDLLNISFNEHFYCVYVTYPDEGKNLETLMSEALKKVSDKIMLEKISRITPVDIKTATNAYTRFNKQKS